MAHAAAADADDGDAEAIGLGASGSRLGFGEHIGARASRGGGGEDRGSFQEFATAEEIHVRAPERAEEEGKRRGTRIPV